MSKKILSIGLALASDDVAREDFASRTSLLDWDIVLFKPEISEFISYADQYKGKPSLSDSRSFQLIEACEHWRREIKQAIESDKTVIVFLTPVQEVYIDTGERQYSGTGRNRVTTRIVNIYSNYNCIPVSLKPTNSRGSSVKLAPKGAEILAPYWSEFSAYSEYNVLLGSVESPACLLTRNGDKVVGTLIRSKVSNGSLVCLPNIDFYRDEFLQEEEPEEEDTSGGANLVWTKDAQQFAARLVGAVVALDSALRSTGEVTPEPAWASDDSFSLAAETALRIQLLEAEAELEDAQRRKESIVEELRLIGGLRGLLYEKGKPLEKVIIDALGRLGFDAKPYRVGSSEFDVVFECPEGRLIGEAEGKDAKAINIDKLRQLAMNIHEDLGREEVKSPAKGVLFGNGFRLLPPSERQVAFTEKCILAAQSSGTALVATQELFKAAQYISDQRDESYAAGCRQAILTGIGLTTLPDPPSNPKSELKDRENDP
jgi:hypothetical protein